MQLTVEPLESRTVLAAGLNETFVASLYQGVLHRAVDSAGLAFWAGGLKDGTMTPAQVGAGIFASAAARAADVGTQYQKFLDRAIDSPGANYWAEVMRAGATREQVKADIAGSDEFFGRAGRNNFGFLNTLYELELLRPLDEAGRVFFGTQLAQGRSRAAVALEIIESPEAAVQTTRQIYHQILNREPGDAGQAFWAPRLLNGMSFEEFAGQVAGSPEFLGAIQAHLAAVNTDDPNAAAAAIAQLTGRFSGDQSVGIPVSPPVGAPVSPTPGDVTQPASVTVNNVTLSPTQLRDLEQLLRERDPAGVGVQTIPSKFWYDNVSGAAGLPGQGTAVFLPAGLQLGGPLPADASGGTSGVFVNGRQITTTELTFLQHLTGGSIAPGRYFVLANGDAGPEGGRAVVNLVQLAQRQGQQPHHSPFSTYDLTGVSVLGDGNFIGVLGTDFTWTS